MGGCLKALVVAAVMILSLTVQLHAKSYIVYRGNHKEGLHPRLRREAHFRLLASIHESEVVAQQSLLYSYQHFDAFAAHLTDEQVSTLSGIGPESPSFRDSGMGDIPKRWKGVCESGNSFEPSNCNKKLIGARWFSKGFEAASGPLNETLYSVSPRDTGGHGTHVASTAAGAFVEGIDYEGSLFGIAKGAAPKARIASYKSCWDDCAHADILAAFDQGIQDGVDVFSVSLSLYREASTPDIFFEDATSIGSFHALQNGIPTVVCAGNSGPLYTTLEQVTPFTITVGASTSDRKMMSSVVLGNSQSLEGMSVTEANKDLQMRFYPLISAADAAIQVDNETLSSLSKFCYQGSLDPEKTKGKIVICLRGENFRLEKAVAVKSVGGAGMILANCKESPDLQEVFPDFYAVPATHISVQEATKLFAYYEAESSPTATITPINLILTPRRDPEVATFSSRGPSPHFPDILKPDVIAPGLSILAAYPRETPQSKFESPGELFRPYEILTGTSMSAPHVAGIVALLKVSHPNWSPAAIKSALVTTAIWRQNISQPQSDEYLNITNPFRVGGGQVNPNSAVQPGLVYDLSMNDYYLFFCTSGFDRSKASQIIHEKYVCPEDVPSVSDLNYPSISISKLVDSTTLNRTVTNVGPPNSVYQVYVDCPDGIDVSFKPTTLRFSRRGEKKMFTVKFTKIQDSKDWVFGSYSWENAAHTVSSPIAVKTSSVYN